MNPATNPNPQSKPHLQSYHVTIHKIVSTPTHFSEVMSDSVISHSSNTKLVDPWYKKKNVSIPWAPADGPKVCWHSWYPCGSKVSQMPCEGAQCLALYSGLCWDGSTTAMPLPDPGFKTGETEMPLLYLHVRVKSRVRAYVGLQSLLSLYKSAS
jgi:hypothetical protein